MTRNTALKVIGWIGTIAAVWITPFGTKVYYEVLAAVAGFGYDFPLPASKPALHEFALAQPKASGTAVVIFLLLLLFAALLIGEVLAALFGERRKPQP